MVKDIRDTGLTPKVFPGPNNRKKSPRWIGALMLLVALGFSIGTIVLLLNQDEESPQPTPESPTQIAQVTMAATDVPTALLTDSSPTNTPQIAPQVVTGELPTIAPDGIALLLSQPILNAKTDDTDTDIERDVYDPFTIIPDRPRNEIIRYVVQEGDTIETIAARFNLKTETLAWSNSREIIQRFLRGGDELNIPPVDGVYIQATGTLKTFNDYASEYGVEDAFAILDSSFNPNLRQYSPDDVPPDGTYMFIPGGESFDVVWPSAVEIVQESGSTQGGSGSGAQTNVFKVTFQNGQQGSCPAQEIGGGTAWSLPLAQGSYNITRGYSTFHPGIDLAASPGTPVRAANGGRVIFAGWNDFGYGYMVALVHGNTMTVYGHMQAYYVNCGQLVDSGQVIGEVGSTGNSSGPHLHFEIRGRSGNTYAPGDPAYTLSF